MTDATNLSMPIAPTGVEYQHVQDDIRLAVRAATEGSQLTTPRVFITISRSAADVATADRNFFLKAMIGVGITDVIDRGELISGLEEEDWLTVDELLAMQCGVMVVGVPGGYRLCVLPIQ
ncbi:hypothetical protein GGI07_002812 [Coemansia sp. Benny D115]|nr:hypothetical protein GGI07_002812 [Coemansia sp. Benny D115]